MFEKLNARVTAAACLVALAACGGQASTLVANEAIVVSPHETSVPEKGQVAFVAAATGISNSVTWTIVEAPAGGQVTATGAYTAPAAAGTFHVTATSTVDPTKSDTATVTVTTTTGTGTLFLNGFFPLCVYGMDQSLFTTWKNRGANCVLDVPDIGSGYPHSTSVIDTWTSQAVAAGFKVFREPHLPATADPLLNDPNLIGWLHIDEPNNNCGTASPPSKELTEFTAWRAASATKPIMTQFSGGDLPGVTHAGCNDVSDYTGAGGFLASSNWYANDRYPVSGYYDNNWSKLSLLDMTSPIDVLHGWATTAPLMAGIECSRINQSDANKSVSPDQMRAELWLAIVHGARGIYYFPQLVGANPFAWDGTIDTVYNREPEMIKQNGIITALAPILQGDIDPSGVSATVSGTLQAAWRIGSDGNTYFIVVNYDSPVISTAAITLSGVTANTTATVYGESRTVTVSNGVIADSFPTYGVHIYVVP
jgi:hypothetical protein